MTAPSEKYPFERIILVGCSSGGMGALSNLTAPLPVDYPFPLVVVQHRSQDERKLLEEILQTKTKMKVSQANEKEYIVSGHVYIAPPGYHLLIEHDLSFSLTSDEPVNYSRPSIDVLFQSAAEVFGKRAVGVVLTGANRDGTNGIISIKEMGGITIAEDPREAAFPYMPGSAIASGKVDHVMSLEKIVRFILELSWKNKK